MAEDALFMRIFRDSIEIEDARTTTAKLVLLVAVRVSVAVRAVGAMHVRMRVIVPMFMAMRVSMAMIALRPMYVTMGVPVRRRAGVSIGFWLKNLFRRLNN
jgi:hypothetical protein